MPSRFLNAHNARHLCQAHHRVVCHIGHTAARHVVQHHRQVNRFGDGLEMQVLAFLRRLVVVGNDLQMAIGTDLFRKAGQLDRLGGGVGTTPSHDWHPPGTVLAGLLDRHADDFAVLLHVDCGRFARGTNHANAVSTFGDVPVNQLAQRGVVHRAIGVHGGDQCDDAAGDLLVSACHVRGCQFKTGVKVTRPTILARVDSARAQSLVDAGD